MILGDERDNPRPEVLHITLILRLNPPEFGDLLGLDIQEFDFIAANIVNQRIVIIILACACIIIADDVRKFILKGFLTNNELVMMVRFFNDTFILLAFSAQ